MDVHWQNSHAQQEGKNLKYSYITSQEHNMLKPTFDFVFHQKSFVCNNGRLSSSLHFSQLEILDLSHLMSLYEMHEMFDQSFNVSKSAEPFCHFQFVACQQHWQYCFIVFSLCVIMAW